ncbi:MAG: 50S ribosomal protein L24 [bacterium]|nr:50S ribosomal protein L24 [bacterium]MDZ4295885.1 50S ribosomal protein L24 [Patescibacteria group bacterium]
MKLKTGDNVLVISGKDRGRTGKIGRVLSLGNKIVIEGINLKKKHQRPRRGGEKGKVITIAHPFPVSNVKLICPSCKQAARVGFSLQSGAKQRVCKKCGATIN